MSGIIQKIAKLSKQDNKDYLLMFLDEYNLRGLYEAKQEQLEAFYTRITEYYE